MIPPWIVADQELTLADKVVCGRVWALSNSKGYCYASNRWLGDQLGLAPGTVSNSIASLASRGHVRVEVQRNEKKEVTSRRVYPIHSPVDTYPPTDGDLSTVQWKEVQEKRRKSRENTLSASADAAAVLDHLNLAAGKKYRQVTTNHKYIKGRLRDGATVDDLKLVTDFKVAEWSKDDKMREYLRPNTLYAAEHWDSYLAAAQEWQAKGRPSSNGAKQADWRTERLAELAKQIKRVDLEIGYLSQKLQAGGDEEDMSRHEELLATREKLAEEGKRVKEGVR